MKKVLFGAVIFVLLASFATAGDKKPIKPTGNDKCPVCGMLVEHFPKFLAQIIFTDGTYAMFEGPKDMFKYYLDMKKYNPSKKPSDIDSVYVTDYSSLKPIDGLKAFYVVGSNVDGPMGR